LKPHTIITSEVKLAQATIRKPRMERSGLMLKMKWADPTKPSAIGWAYRRAEIKVRLKIGLAAVDVHVFLAEI